MQFRDPWFYGDSGSASTGRFGFRLAPLEKRSASRVNEIQEMKRAHALSRTPAGDSLEPFLNVCPDAEHIALISPPKKREQRIFRTCRPTIVHFKAWDSQLTICVKRFLF